MNRPTTSVTHLSHKGRGVAYNRPTQSYNILSGEQVSPRQQPPPQTTTSEAPTSPHRERRALEPVDNNSGAGVKQHGQEQHYNPVTHQPDNLNRSIAPNAKYGVFSREIRDQGVMKMENKGELDIISLQPRAHAPPPKQYGVKPGGIFAGFQDADNKGNKKCPKCSKIILLNPQHHADRRDNAWVDGQAIYNTKVAHQHCFYHPRPLSSADKDKYDKDQDYAVYMCCAGSQASGGCTLRP